MLIPSYDGLGLVNLMAEVETRLIGRAEAPGLEAGLAASIPDAETYVLVLFDGLGTAQLSHPKAGSLAASLRGVLQAPFPTTTSVSLATVATGLPPSLHGQVAHLTWFEDLELVVNTLKWVTMSGDLVSYDYSSLLPSPNLWERLRSAGVEPITVQPAEFDGSPLTQLLYRGARYEGVSDIEELVTATVQLASEPGRLLFTYVPHVDFAGHMHGQGSDEFAQAMMVASGVWEGLSAKLSPEAVLIGTADHGLIEFGGEQKQLIRDPSFDELRLAGDTRGIHLWGDPGLMRDLAEVTGGSLVDPVALIGPDPTPAALSRLGEKLLIPPHDKAVIPKGFDKRLRCYHGGVARAEVEIPLLLR